MKQTITGNKERVQRYRAKHRRFDYVPSPEALAAIERSTRDCVTALPGCLTS